MMYPVLIDTFIDRNNLFFCVKNSLYFILTLPAMIVFALPSFPSLNQADNIADRLLNPDLKINQQNLYIESYLKSYFIISPMKIKVRIRLFGYSQVFDSDIKICDRLPANA